MFSAQELLTRKKSFYRLKNVFVLLLMLVTIASSFGQATLPLSRTNWDGAVPAGWTDNGTGTYLTSFACTGNNSGQLNSTGDYYQIYFSSAPDQLTFTLKGASFSGGTFTVQESVDGVTWNTLSTFTSISGSCSNHTFSLACDTRYVRFIYTNRATGNIQLDDVSITAGSPCVACSGCSIDDAGITSIACNNNATNSDSADDYISFSLNPTGCDLGATYSVAVSGGSATSISPSSASYGSATTFSLNTGSAGGGNVTVTITDVTGGTCTLDVVVNDPGICSGVMPSACAKIIQFQLDPEGGNNGTLNNTGEFIQICNICTGEVDISCFVLCFTENDGGSRRGDCIRIPDNTILAPGECYLMGGNGTTGAGADWTTAEATLDLNWHTCGCTVDVDGSGIGEYVGVLSDGGEDITLFDASGNVHSAITYASGGGATYSETVNIPSGSGCGTVDVTIPPSSSHTNIGSTPAASLDDEGWYYDCALSSWVFANHDSGDAFPDLFPNMTYDCPLVTILSDNTIRLEGKNENKTNILTWHTLDNDIDYFTIYKSENNFDYTPIIEVKNNNANKYHFNDKAIAKLTYYKIEAHASSGALLTSNVISLKDLNNGESFFVSDIYPNPANNSYSFNLQIKERNQEIALDIYNVIGEKVQSYTYSESQNVTLQSSDLANGFYHLVFHSENNIQSVKLIIEH